MIPYSEHDFLSRSMMQFCWAVLCVLLGLYLWNLYGLVYDSDLAILTSFAQRMLEEHKFSEMYYEANPPLSILIYVPVLWIQSLSGLEIYHAHFFYTMAVLGISVALSASLLRRWVFWRWPSVC